MVPGISRCCAIHRQLLISIFIKAHSGRTSGKTACEKMFSIAAQIVSESKAAIEASEGQKTLAGWKDLLSVLLEADMSPDVPERSLYHLRHFVRPVNFEKLRHLR